MTSGMGTRSLLISATVLDVGDEPFVYPACKQCYAKLRNISCYLYQVCSKCGMKYEASDICYRYRLCLKISDGLTVRNTTAFGGTLVSFFGTDATDFKLRYLSRLSEKFGALSNVITRTAIEQVFVGNMLIFGFKIPMPLKGAKSTDDHHEQSGESASSYPTLRDLGCGTNICSSQGCTPDLIATRVLPQSISHITKTVVQHLSAMESALERVSPHLFDADKLHRFLKYSLNPCDIHDCLSVGTSPWMSGCENISNLSLTLDSEESIRVSLGTHSLVDGRASLSRLCCLDGTSSECSARRIDSSILEDCTHRDFSLQNEKWISQNAQNVDQDNLISSLGVRRSTRIAAKLKEKNDEKYGKENSFGKGKCLDITQKEESNEKLTEARKLCPETKPNAEIYQGQKVNMGKRLRNQGSLTWCVTNYMKRQTKSPLIYPDTDNMPTNRSTCKKLSSRFTKINEKISTSKQKKNLSACESVVQLPQTFELSKNCVCVEYPRGDNSTFCQAVHSHHKGQSSYESVSEPSFTELSNRSLTLKSHSLVQAECISSGKDQRKTRLVTCAHCSVNFKCIKDSSTLCESCSARAYREHALISAECLHVSNRFHSNLSSNDILADSSVKEVLETTAEFISHCWKNKKVKLNEGENVTDTTIEDMPESEEFDLFLAACDHGSVTMGMQQPSFEQKRKLKQMKVKSTEDISHSVKNCLDKPPDSVTPGSNLVKRGVQIGNSNKNTPIEGLGRYKAATLTLKDANLSETTEEDSQKLFANVTVRNGKRRRGKISPQPLFRPTQINNLRKNQLFCHEKETPYKGAILMESRTVEPDETVDSTFQDIPESEDLSVFLLKSWPQEVSVEVKEPCLLKSNVNNHCPRQFWNCTSKDQDKKIQGTLTTSCSKSAIPEPLAKNMSTLGLGIVDKSADFVSKAFLSNLTSPGDFNESDVNVKSERVIQSENDGVKDLTQNVTSEMLTLTDFSPSQDMFIDESLSVRSSSLFISPRNNWKEKFNEALSVNRNFSLINRQKPKTYAKTQDVQGGFESGVIENTLLDNMDHSALLDTQEHQRLDFMAGTNGEDNRPTKTDFSFVMPEVYISTSLDSAGDIGHSLLNVLDIISTNETSVANESSAELFSSQEITVGTSLAVADSPPQVSSGIKRHNDYAPSRYVRCCQKVKGLAGEFKSLVHGHDPVMREACTHRNSSPYSYNRARAQRKVRFRRTPTEHYFYSWHTIRPYNKAEENAARLCCVKDIGDEKFLPTDCNIIQSYSEKEPFKEFTDKIATDSVDMDSLPNKKYEVPIIEQRDLSCSSDLFSQSLYQFTVSPLSMQNSTHNFANRIYNNTELSKAEIHPKDEATAFHTKGSGNTVENNNEESVLESELLQCCDSFDLFSPSTPQRIFNNQTGPVSSPTHSPSFQIENSSPDLFT